MKNELSIFEKTYSMPDIPSLAEELFSKFGKFKIWLFEGELGAGKTTLIQHLAKQLKIDEEVNSPTFSLINEYKSASFGKVYHMDLYRLKTLKEADEIGMIELVDSGYFCLIEWASAIGFESAEPYVLISIKHLHQFNRLLSVRIYEN